MLPLPSAANLSDTQRYVAEMERERGFADRGVVEQCLPLGEEVGELFKAVRKYNKLYDEGQSTPPEQARANLAEELVDVFNYLLAIANRTGVDLEKAFREKNARNQQRTWS